MKAKYPKGLRIRTLSDSEHQKYHTVDRCSACTFHDKPGEHHFTGTITGNCDTMPLVYPAKLFSTWYQVRLDCGNLLGIEESSFEIYSDAPKPDAWNHDLDRRKTNQ